MSMEKDIEVKVVPRGEMLKARWESAEYVAEHFTDEDFRQQFALFGYFPINKEKTVFAKIDK